MPLRIDQAVDPLRSRHRKAHRHRLARLRRQAILRRLAVPMRAEGIGFDQSGVLRENLARQGMHEDRSQRRASPSAPGRVGSDRQ